jgi:hypothetical protein
MSAALMHERTEDGRERHFMTRVGAFWVCECGAVQDKSGRLVEPSLVVVPGVEE